MLLAGRTDKLSAEGAYQVLARAQALEARGHTIIHLEIGEPDFATPASISEAGIEAIRAGKTRYNPPSGLSALREKIAEEAGRRRGLSFTPQQVVVSPGAKPNLFLPTLALINPGDEVIYPDPGFPTYSAMITVAGGVPVPVPLLEENSFSFDLRAFDQLISVRTRLIIVNSPGNPTGGVMPPEDLDHIAQAAVQHDCWVLSDEIYGQILFDGKQAASIASIPGMMDRTIIVDGFSKTYAMTGWRLGFGIMPEPLAERVGLLLTHSLGCTAHFTQIAGLQALAGPQDSAYAMVREYQRRRDLLVAGLNRLPGVTCQLPQGAFYAFPNIRQTRLSSNELAVRMLDGGVALLPGSAFGQHGEGYLRLAYANSLENIELALQRMEVVLFKLRESETVEAKFHI
jgi:aspartate/methionine/tyrosine aminotransferase